MRAEKQNRLPSAGARIPAFLCALILTGCLLATLLSLGLIQVLTDAGLHTRAALARDSVDLQMERIQAEVQALAGEYGFAPGTLDALVTREKVEQYDREIVAWWTGAATAGSLEEEPAFPLDGLMDALRADSGFAGEQEEVILQVNADAVGRKLQSGIGRSAVLFRDLLLQAGIRFAGDTVDLPMMTALMRKIPLITGLAALLMAGLVALCMSRRIQTAGQYIGGALAACGLLMIGFAGVLRMLNLRGMIAEASRALEMQFVHLSHTLTLEILGCAAVLLVLGALLMLLARKELRKA